LKNIITLYERFLNESDSDEKSFEEFAKTRLDGATKIAESAKERGGDALLTYYHFIVKLPYYKKAADGKFDLSESKKELAEHLKTIDGSTKAIKLKQMEFQRIVGQIEVLGELIIKYNETHNFEEGLDSIKEELKNSNPEFFNEDGNISIADMSNDTFIKFMSGVIFDIKNEIGSDSPYAVIQNLVYGLGLNYKPQASTLLLAASEETQNYLKEIYNFYQNSTNNNRYRQEIEKSIKEYGIQKEIDWINRAVTLNNLTAFKQVDSLSLDEYVKIKLGFSFFHQYPNENRFYSDFAFNPATAQTLFRIPSKQVLDDFKKITEIFAYSNVPDYSEIKEEFLKLENFKNLSEEELIDLYNTKNLTLDSFNSVK
jgi:hypothetical protein